MTTTQDTATAIASRLELVRRFAAGLGFTEVHESDLPEGLEGCDMLVAPFGNIVWDAEGNLGLSDDMGDIVDDVDAETLAIMPDDEVTDMLASFFGAYVPTV